MAQNFRIDDLVWGKLSGYDPWPGQIIEPSFVGEKSRTPSNTHCVLFLGSRNYAFLPPNKIYDYREHRADLVKCYKQVMKTRPKSKVKRWGQIYKKAVEEADDFAAILDAKEAQLQEVVYHASNPDWTSSLGQEMLSLQRRGHMTDVVMFDQHHNKVVVHSVVLACCSTWWKNVFQESERTLKDKVTYSWRCSYLNPEIWTAITELLYTGDATLASKALFPEVIQQMQNLRLDKILDHLQSTRNGSNTWQNVLVSEMYQYQQAEKFCDFVLKSDNQNNMADEDAQTTEGGKVEETFSIKAHAPVMLASMGRLQYEKGPLGEGRYELCLSGVQEEVIDNVVEFLYTGKCTVEKCHLDTFKRVAKKLKISAIESAGYVREVCETMTGAVNKTKLSPLEMKDEQCSFIADDQSNGPGSRVETASPASSACSN